MRPVDRLSAVMPDHNILRTASVLITDDDKDLLAVLQEWFTLFCREVHVAANGAAALALYKQHRFDVVLTDLQMPGFDGMQSLSILRELDPAVAVVFLTGQGTLDDAVQALRGGRAFDFLLKPVKDFKALNLVVERAIEHSRQQASRARTKPLTLPEIDPLSPRELEVIMALAEGLDNSQIGSRLILSEKTIKNHLTRIYEKLRVSNRTQAVLTSQNAGLI